MRKLEKSKLKESKTTLGVEEHSLVFPLSRNYKERSGGRGLSEQLVPGPAGILRVPLGSTRVQDRGSGAVGAGAQCRPKGEHGL